MGHEAPDLVLLGRVLDVRDGPAAPVAAAHFGDRGPARPVGVVGEPGVVLGQLEPGRAGGGSCGGDDAHDRAPALTIRSRIDRQFETILAPIS
jgi:hypothetical protein